MYHHSFPSLSSLLTKTLSTTFTFLQVSFLNIYATYLVISMKLQLQNRVSETNKEQLPGGHQNSCSIHMHSDPPGAVYGELSDFPSGIN